MANWWDKYESAEPKAAAPSGNWWDKYEKADAQEHPTLNANASGSAGVDAPKSAWIDETMGQYTRDRAGIARLESEAKAAGVPLGRAVKWKRNQLERQDREGALQPPTTAPLSLGDANESSVNERAAIIRAAEQVQSSPLATWPNTGSKTSIPGEGDDAELTSALDVLENYRKRVSPEVPGPQFMRQMFPRGTAQEAAKDPDGSWGAAGESMLQGVRQSVAGGAQAIGERLRYAGNSVPAIRDAINVPANALRVAGYEQGAESLARMSELGAGLAQRPTGSVYDDPDGWARYLGQQGVAGSGPTLVGMGAGLVNPVLGAATFMGSAAGSEYGKARIEDNATPSEAGVRAVTAAATEGIPEAIGGAAMLGRLPLMKLAQSTARGRAAIAMPVEAGTEALTEKANIELERARGKYISPEEESRRIQDAAVIGGVMGGTIGAGTSVAEGGASGLLNIRETIRQANSAADISSPMAAAFTRAAQETTARILGPTATPDAAAGAQIADDAFRAAGVGTVAAADMAEQDALARDLDAAQRDQLGIEAEIDRLLTGNAPRAPSIPGAIPRGVRVTSDQDGFAAPGTIGGRDAPAPLQVTTLADRSVFVPGDPVAIRRKLADAGSQWQGMAQERDGIVGVRFSPTSWADVQGVVGGSVRSTVGNREVVDAARSASLAEYGGTPARDGEGAPRAYDASGLGSRAEPVGTSAPAVGIAGNAGGTTTQAAVAVDGRNLAGNEQRSIDRAPELPQPAVGTQGVPLRSEQGATDTGRVLEDAGRVSAEPSAPSPPALRDLTDDERNFWPALTSEIRESIDNPGGRMIRNADGSVGRTKWADLGPMSGFWRERPANWNSDVVLTALDRAQTGEKLSVKQRNIVEYAKGWVRQYAADNNADLLAYEQDSKTAQRESVRDDIESTLASVADTSPQQRASVISLGHDYTARLIELKRARAAGALNPDQQEAYIDLLEQDRETGKVAGRPMIGIGNKTAYVDAQMQGKLMPVQVFLDADNFKALNDKFGHDVGDDAIRLIADVVRAEFGDGNVFHRGGDEFLTQGMTQEEVDAKMARVQDYLARVKMELPLSDGRTATLTGVGVSYGTGANEKAADDSLKQDKQRRKDAGLRFDRREGDDAGRVGSQSSGAGTEASGANSRDSSRAAAEGVGDERQNRTNLPDAGSSREVAGRRGDAERAPDDLGGSGPRTEAVRGGQAGSREVSGGIATVRSAISQALGAKFLRRLESQPWFHLVGTLADLPANIRKSITDGGNVAGFVLGNDVYIIADQASDPVGVTLHEVGVHFGMSGILGADFPAVLRNFKRQRAKDAAVGRAYERATEAAERGEDGELTADALATLDEEALAYYVEANWNAKDSRGIVAKVIDAIKSMLNRLGIPLSTLNASPEMLRNVAIGAARKAADGRVSVGKNGVLRYHKAWHGSPHDFDKFRYDDTTSHTGEGAQAYGAGLYFAGNQEVAEHYRKPGPWSHRSDIMIDGVSVKRKAADSEAEKVALNALARTVTKADAIDYLQQDSGTEDAVDWIRANSARITDTAGRLYEVELAPNESDYLDWDAPLSEQSEKVREGVRRAIRVGAATVARGDGDRPFSVSIDGKTLYRYRSEADAQEYADELNEVSASEARIQMDSESATTGEQAYRAISESKGGDREASRALHAAGIPGIRYLDGSSRGKGEGSRNFVIFDDSQVEVKAKYSRRADGGPVTESDKLVALHNVSPEGLLFADKIGGLAVPSIGITKAATPFTGFGSVTLIGSRDLATPSGDNPVFSADAFTQRFPDVEWPAVPYKKANDFLASIDPDVRRRDTDELHDHMVNHPDRDKAIDDGRKSATFMKAWLAEVGDAPAQDVTEKRVPPHRAQWAVRPAWTDAVDRLAARGVDVRNLREGSPEWAELDKAARQAIEQEADSYAGLSKTLADEMREDMLAFFGDSLSLGDGDRAIRFAMAKDESPRTDRYATKRALQDQIGDRMPKFSAWVASKIAPLFGEPSIRIGRKKVPMTLDNIVEAMTSKAVAGKESTMTFSTGKAKAMNAKRYRTLEEVQADRAKIVSTEAEKGAIDASDKLIEQYRDAVLPYTSEIYNDRIDTWAALDASMKALADAGKKAATVANMRSALARNGFRGVDDDTVQLGVDALIALRETVTDYFEAKPQRAVKLSEFAGAVVKSSEADQVRPVLEKHGVEVREYSGEDAERRVAIDEFTKELEAKRGKIRFSRRAQTITVDGTERPTTDSTGKAIHPTEEGVRNFWRWFSPSPSQLLDGLSVSEVSGLKRDTEALADFIESQAGLSESDRFAVIPPSVFAHVAGAVNNDEILNAVVRSLPVDVVDFLASKKLSPKQVFNDPAMLKDVFSVNPASDVALAVNPARIAEIAVRVVANAGAKISGVTNGALKRNAAMLADKSDPVLGAHVRKSAAGDLGIVAGFGDSKIIDAQGRPLLVYHGGADAVDSFDPSMQGDASSGVGIGYWFTTSLGYASEYAQKAGGSGGGSVGTFYISSPRAIVARSPRGDGMTVDGEPMDWEDNAAAIDYALRNGADGIYFKDGSFTDEESVVVFSPKQIKSAESNTGTFSPTDKRIAYSRKTPAEARAESAQKQADLGAQLVVSPGQSFVYTDKFTDDWRGQTLKMRERIQDKLLSVRNVQQDIEKIRGAIQDAMNVYRRENLMHGRVGDQRDKLQDTHVKPLIEAMAEAKVSPALLEDYLEARHAKERNEKIAATKGGMPDGASGMTTAQAEDFLQGRAAGHRSGVTLDPAMTRQVSRLGRKVYAITAETRRRLLDSGQITQEAFDALENAYAAYVPLRGKDGTESGKGRGTGKGIDVRGKPIQRAAGRGEGNRAQNILAEVIADAERSIINAEKLRVGRTLARLVLENPNPDVWAIEPVKTELKVSDGTPEEIYEAVKNLDQEEGTIIVKVKGKPYRIVIEDQRMADALKNMAVETVPEVIQYVAGLNRYFSAVLTRYNPSFVGVNMTRDLLFGMTGIWAEHGTAAAAKAAASYFPAMRAAWRDIQGKPPVNAMGRYAREFAEAGGKTYFGKLENVSDMSQRIGEEFKTFRQMAMPKFLGGEMSPVRALAKVARDSKMVQAIEAVNDTVENTLRLSVYAARREAGASIEQAAEYAKNISVNFNRRGSATSWLNALYLFFNAATQGAHRTLTLLKNPKVQGVLGGLAALQATSAMFLMGLDDEDGEPLWDSISSWDKQRNLILAIPIKRENGWGATVIKIPMPYGFNLFPYMGGRSVELARDLQEKPAGRAIADYTTDAVVGVAQAMSPIPFDDGWKAALPHWVRIFTVLSENKDDLGIPIRAGDQYDSFDKPRSASGRDDTPLPFKVAATALNRLGGGDDYTPPYAKFALDWAPEDLAYLFKTFAGGLGSNVVKSGTLTEKLIAGVPVNFKDVPVLSSFVSNVDQRQATSTRYYDHKDDIEREVARQRDLAKETGEVGDNQMGIKIARNKSGVKVKRGEGYELEGKPGSLFDTYKQAEKDISRIRDEMRAAFNDQSISYTERIRKIDELKAEREEVQRELNAAWREQRKKRTQ